MLQYAYKYMYVYCIIHVPIIVQSNQGLEKEKTTATRLISTLALYVNN